MKIILMDDVPALGRRGEVRDVSDGYARNYLLPHKLALHAAAVKLTAKAQEQARAIEALHFTQTRQASDEGRLFGSIGKADVASFLSQNGIEIERRRITMDEPIKSIGEFSVPVRLHGDV